jgi:hypothetical protein
MQFSSGYRDELGYSIARAKKGYVGLQFLINEGNYFTYNANSESVNKTEGDHF